MPRCSDRTHDLHSRRWIVFVFAALLTAGCFRTAGETNEPTAESLAQTPQTFATTAAAPVDTAATPTLGLPITLLSPNSGAQETSASESIEQSSAVPTSEPQEAAPTAAHTAPPTTQLPITLIPLIGQTFAPTRAPIVPTATLPSLAPSQVYITPHIPLGPVTPDTPMPSPTLDPAVTATPSGLVTPTALPGTDPNDCLYLVQPGDSLYAIAIRNGFSLEEVRAANPDLVGEAPILQIGQQINLPGCEGETTPEATAGGNIVEPVPVDPNAATPAPDAPPGEIGAGGQTYTVRAGDTLYTIAIRFGTTVQALIEANNLANPNALSIGQVLIIPSGE